MPRKYSATVLQFEALDRLALLGVAAENKMPSGGLEGQPGSASADFDGRGGCGSRDATSQLMARLQIVGRIWQINTQKRQKTKVTHH